MWKFWYNFRIMAVFLLHELNSCRRNYSREETICGNTVVGRLLTWSFFVITFWPEHDSCAFCSVLTNLSDWFSLLFLGWEHSNDVWSVLGFSPFVPAVSLSSKWIASGMDHPYITLINFRRRSEKRQLLCTFDAKFVYKFCGELFLLV